MFDVVIVGGGTAGLSAALVLGRARRRVLLASDGPQRNAPAEAAHGMFTRDGTPPFELLRIGREQLEPYETVELRATAVTSISGELNNFRVTLADGRQEAARMVVLATGVGDQLPDIPGFTELWGHGVYHCRYCHGWEARDQRLGVFASGEDAMHLAPLVHNWSPNLTVLSHGPAGLDDRQRAILNRIGIAVCESPIARLIVEGGSLAGVLFEDGRDIPLDGIFTRTQIRPHNALAKELGCDLIGEGLIAGLIQVDQRGQTSVPGVYAAGDIATLLQQVGTAAASGATVAAMINHALVEQTVHAALAG